MSSDLLQAPIELPEIPFVPSEAGAREPTTLGLVELLLKEPARVDELSLDPARQRELLPRLLLISQVSYVIFGIVMVLVLNVAPAAALAYGPVLGIPPAAWHDGTALGLLLAYNLGIVLAACVCLPSFYFYSLLAGVRMSWLQISLVAGKGTAANAVMLLGILPIYVAVVLGGIVLRAPPHLLHTAIVAGLLLPFVSGLWGLREIYRGIVTLSIHSAPQQCPRACFLRRLTFAWAGVYTLVVPVMIYRLWEHFAAGVRGM
jgi:hypothetical protein